MSFRPLFAACGLAALVGCGLIGMDPRPTEVRLTQDRLIVDLSGGGRCTMARPQGEAAWFGTLQNCAIDWPYRVALDPRPNILRKLVEAIFVGGAASGVLAAVGTVEITDPRTGEVLTFVSPPPTAND